MDLNSNNHSEIKENRNSSDGSPEDNVREVNNLKAIPETNEYAKWIDNEGNEVQEVFGFNHNAELVNSRAAMFGFLMLILTELVFKGEAVTKSIFGIGI
tara:strand:+ start:102 stop:398 length:297 start_codon:yes stop_codon:yes gene_type:complete